MAFWPLGLYFLCVIALVVAMLVASWLLGQRHRDPGTDIPYEGGILGEGSARVRLSAKFYLVAMFFVVFDLEAVFLYAWAVAGRELGWRGYWGMATFAGTLILVLVYLWRAGALDWGQVRRHTR